MTSDATQGRQRGLSEEATRWLVVLQSRELSVEERGQFVDWLRESPTHIAELMQMGDLDARLGRLPLWRTSEPMDDLPSNIVPLGNAARNAPAPRSTAVRWSRWAVAASLVMTVAVGYLTLAHRGDIRLRTMPGEHRALALEDGSVVDLAPDTDLMVRYEAHRRGIRLAHGQATFRVAKNPQRPFIVEAADTQVLAVGTVFDVERDENGILVSVAEGHVAVSRQRRLSSALKSGPSPAVVSLNPNQEILIRPSGEASSVRQKPVQPQPRVARAAESLSFENEAVADVAQKFNARNSLRIEVLSPDVGSRRISGVFNADDPESFIAFVQAVTDADVNREMPDRVLISRK